MWKVSSRLDAIWTFFLKLLTYAIVAGMIFFKRWTIERPLDYDPGEARLDDWDWCYAAVPLYLNKQFIWLQPFWISVSETPTDRIVETIRIHPQQIPMKFRVFRTQFIYQTQRDRMYAKLKQI